jgi:hypothetical protein
LAFAEHFCKIPAGGQVDWPVNNPTFGRISADNPNFELYRQHLRRTTEEPFALFLPG